MSKQLEEMRTLLADAQQQLDAALLAGDDATNARERVRVAEAEVQRIEALIEDQREAETAKKKDQRERAAEAMAADADEVFNQALAELATITVPTMEIPRGTLVAKIAAAEQYQADVSTMAAWQRRLGAAQDQLHALGRRRQTIIDRRASGECNDDADGRELALIDADAEGLRDLIARINTEMPPMPSKADMEAAAARHQAAVDDTMAQALNTIASNLEAALITVADELARRMPGTVPNAMARRYKPDPRFARAVNSGVW